MQIERNDEGSIAVVRSNRMQVFSPGVECGVCGSTASCVVVDPKVPEGSSNYMGIAMCDYHVDNALDRHYDAEVKVAEFQGVRD